MKSFLNLYVAQEWTVIWDKVWEFYTDYLKPHEFIGIRICYFIS